MPTPEEVMETAGDLLLATCPAEPDFLSAVWEQSLGANSATHQIRMRNTISYIPHAE
ncbi:MAG: hypothetical protein GY759_24230 [Chloroflexi bacterium]|nr:hypothetical protein [Chloroflexota bacterium]